MKITINQDDLKYADDLGMVTLYVYLAPVWADLTLSNQRMVNLWKTGRKIPEEKKLFKAPNYLRISPFPVLTLGSSQPVIHPGSSLKVF